MMSAAALCGASRTTYGWKEGPGEVRFFQRLEIYAFSFGAFSGMLFA